MGKQKRDVYYKKAKKEGFHARSAYKLIEIDKKYHALLPKKRFPRLVLDLGCSPGSWIEVLLKKREEYPSIHKKIKIVAIDRTSLNKSLESLQEEHIIDFYRVDVFSEEVVSILEKYPKFDLILSDLAPKTSGDFRDVAIQEEMVERVFSFIPYLKSGGNLVVKIFQSEKTSSFLKRAKSLFKFAKLMKPSASRPKSREIYLIAIDKI